MQELLGPSHCPRWRGSPGTPGGWPTARQVRAGSLLLQAHLHRSHPPTPPPRGPLLAHRPPWVAGSDSLPRPLADLPVWAGPPPGLRLQGRRGAVQGGRALIPWAPSRQPGRDMWVGHQLGALEGTGPLGATRTAASLCLSPEMFRHTSSGTTNPSLGKPKALASSQPPLGCRSTSGGGSVVCHRLHIGRDGALVTARGLQGGGTRGPGTSEFSTHSEPSPHSPEHTQPAEPRWNRTQPDPLRCALRMRPDVSF